MSNPKLKGSLYCRKGRWWWKAKLPGEDKITYHPLRPKGAKFATKDRTIAEKVATQIWENAVFKSSQSTNNVTDVASLVKMYLEYARHYYKGTDGKLTREPENIQYAVRPLVKFYGTLSAEDFGPLKLKELRQQIIGLGWCRNVINQRVGIIKRMFKWAVSEELLSDSVYSSLTRVEGLRRGRSGARETKKVKPVDESYVRAILPHTTPTVAAMIELQLLTGMRSSEVCTMRPCDIDTSGDIWIYRPEDHKTKNYGHSKEIYIGPRGQDILLPFLARERDIYCFTPADSEKQRERKNHFPKKLRPRYDKNSYRRAMLYAIAAARRAGVNIPDFHPHQIRHTVATQVTKEYGIEAAKVLLGHRNLKVTEGYAEPEKASAIKAASELG